MLLAAMAITASCIKNDIPYPYVEPQIEEIHFDGELATPTIDPEKRKINVDFPETIDLHHVSLRTAIVNPEASLSIKEGDILDLSQPYIFHSSLYERDFQWSIVAHQHISRIFTIQNQVGASVIDTVGHRAIAYVGKKISLQSIVIDSLKLEEEGAVLYSPKSEELLHTPLDMRLPLQVEIKGRKGITKWTLLVYQKEKTVETLPADAWCYRAYLHALGSENETPGFEYCEEGSSEWQKVPQEAIRIEGGSFHATLHQLKPNTSYIYHAISGNEKGEDSHFTTVAPEPLPQGDFEQWSQEGKVWNPWSNEKERFWDTGNKGIATVGESNVIPIKEDTPPESNSQYAVRLQSKWAFIKLAAGSLFLGRYLRTDGTNGVLSFGIPYSAYPTKLQGYYKYHTAAINRIGDKRMKALEGRPDSCHIYALLTDLEAPIEIRTNPSNRQLIDFQADYVIAKAELISGDESPQWQKFSIEFEYKATNRRPRQLILVISSSKYGDFFTGSDQAQLFVDQFSFQFD